MENAFALLQAWRGRAIDGNFMDNIYGWCRVPISQQFKYALLASPDPFFCDRN